MGVAALGAFLQTHESFFATTHTNADGDALASALAVAACCRQLGRPCRVIIPDPAPDATYRFLPGIESVEGPDALEAGLSDEAAVVVDVPNLDRLGPVQDFLPPLERVANIDHHPSNTGFGGAVCVDPLASSSVELVHDVVRYLGLTIDREMATLIYTGIVFDTGRFSFSNTSPKAVAIAAEMLRLGVDPHAVSRAIFYERPVASLRALGSCLEALELHLDGRVSIMTVPQALYVAHSDPPLDTEGFVDAALSVEGVEVACLLKEEKPGLVSVSLRSKGPCDVDAVARCFEGGGHVKAAGCRLSGSVAEAKTRVLEELAQALRLGAPTEVARD
ncbi:MAG: bifunctional oligoribonuclease/PAP phosphatase NrnA [bacterium]|jgi:phosphoesterase RecJ-like protein